MSPDSLHEPPAAPNSEGDTRSVLVARLFREHNQALVSLLALRLNSLQDAKEVAQEAYVRLLQLDRPGAASLLRSYLFRIATNLAVDRLRQRAVRWRSTSFVEAEVFELLAGRDEPERQAVASDELEFVRRCIDELPQPSRRIFWRHRVQEASVADLAGEFSITERTVRYHLGRALIYCQLRLGGATPAQAQERLKR
jgi:RNA polymerase sigma factor (sigma-70 family)